MISGILKSKKLTKDISCDCKCRFDGTKCYSNQWWNNDKCWYECKKIHICKNVKYEILLNVTIKMENI